MNRKSLGLILLVFGILLFLGGLMAGVSGFRNMFKALEPVAAFKSPSSVEFQVSDAGTYTLWHDHRYLDGTTREEHGPYPGGFTFLLDQSSTNGPHTPKFTPISPGSTQTLSTNTREAVALGTFEITTPGTYVLSGNNTTAEARRFSLTKGAFTTHLAGFMTRTILLGILSLLGLAITISGIIILILGPKKATPPTLSPA